MKLLQVSNIKVDITEDEKTAFKKALKKAGLSKDKVSSWKIIKLSIDARKKVEMHFRHEKNHLFTCSCWLWTSRYVLCISSCT